MLGRGIIWFFARKSSSKKSTKKSKQGNKKSIDHEEFPEQPESCHKTASTSDESLKDSELKKILEPAPTAASLMLRLDASMFSCEERIFAYDVNYAMVTVVTNAWNRDVKTIPNWDSISGEILLRKYVIKRQPCYFCEIVSDNRNIQSHMQLSYLSLGRQNIRIDARMQSHVWLSCRNQTR
jgi:hypothetical protein